MYVNDTILRIEIILVSVNECAILVSNDIKLCQHFNSANNVQKMNFSVTVSEC